MKLKNQFPVAVMMARSVKYLQYKHEKLSLDHQHTHKSSPRAGGEARETETGQADPWSSFVSHFSQLMNSNAVKDLVSKNNTHTHTVSQGKLVRK